MSTFKKDDRVRYTGNHPSVCLRDFIGRTGTVVDASPRDTIRVMWDIDPTSPRGHYPANLEIIMPAIDTTKPLEFYTEYASDSTNPATFITETSEGHLLVGSPNKTKGPASSVDWVIFTKDGEFVRSSDNSGKALKLRNKVERITRYHAIVGGVVVIDQGYEQLGVLREFNPAAKFAVRIDSEKNVTLAVKVIEL